MVRCACCGVWCVDSSVAFRTPSLRCRTRARILLRHEDDDAAAVVCELEESLFVVGVTGALADVVCFHENGKEGMWSVVCC